MQMGTDGLSVRFWNKSRHAEVVSAAAHLYACCCACVDAQSADCSALLPAAAMAPCCASCSLRFLRAFAPSFGTGAAATTPASRPPLQDASCAEAVAGMAHNTSNIVPTIAAAFACQASCTACTPMSVCAPPLI